jgi:GTP cyclohydrolase IA
MNKQLTEFLFQELLTKGLGLDLADPNLCETPQRLAKMYCDELLVGTYKPEPKTTVFPNSKKYDQMILSDKLSFNSLCSHHFLPFTGQAWILYIPDSHLLGLSKFSRILTWYASKPQLQENLTHEVTNHLVEKLKPKGVMVVIRAIHQCMTCRGVKQNSGAGMVTSAIYGEFEKPEVRAEGFNLINLST